LSNSVPDQKNVISPSSAAARNNSVVMGYS